MRELRYTLLSDGPSDRALLPLLTWLLRNQGVITAIQPEWADLSRLPKRPQGLVERICKSIDLYPCDLLCIHRDAEREPHDTRKQEIVQALAEVTQQIQSCPPAVSVIPVRMQEAWLLFDEAAIRRAAGNPNGRHPLPLPRMHQVEGLPDPKENLYELLREASGLNSHRRKQLRVSQLAQRVAELITDFSPLRALPAFTALEADLQRILQTHRWIAP